MRSVLAILLAALLASCGGVAIPGAGGWPGGGPSAVSMDASAWDFRYGTGISGHPSAAVGGFAFNFPASGDIDYLTTNVSIAATQHVHAEAQIALTAGTPSFVATDGCTPATFGVMLEIQNDDLRGEDGRWWSRLERPALSAPGAYTFDVSLSDLAQWSNVQGHTASDRPAQFHATMANLGAVGLTFGACSFGHGVSISSGTVRMTVTAFSVN